MLQLHGMLHCVECENLGSEGIAQEQSTEASESERKERERLHIFRECRYTYSGISRKSISSSITLNNGTFGRGQA